MPDENLTPEQPAQQPAEPTTPEQPPPPPTPVPTKPAHHSGVEPQPNHEPP